MTPHGDEVRVSSWGGAIVVLAAIGVVALFVALPCKLWELATRRV